MFQRLIVNNFLAVAATPLVALSLPASALADDQRLEAALRRIEALEKKMERMSSLEDENKELKSRLQRAEKAVVTTSAAKPKSTIATTMPATPTVAPAASLGSPQDASQKWQGFYAGINAGYGANVNNRRLQRDDGYDTADVYYAGGIVGLQAGYNEVLANNFVLGIETEANYANVYDVNGSLNTSSLGPVIQSYYNYPNYIYTVIGGYYNSYYSQTGLEALGSTRLRLGYAIGNFMPFISGGVGYGMVSHETRSKDINTAASYYPGFPIYSVDSSYNASVAAGWAAGGGFEYMLADNWSTKFEYLYTSIGQIHFNNTNETYGFFGVNQARIGLNYHFGDIGK
jgi:opacity protein-like surface antigen